MGWQDAPLISEAKSAKGWQSAPLVDEPKDATTISGKVNAFKDTVADTYKNVGLGVLKGAADIGSTILQPIDYVKDKITGKTERNLSSLVSGEKPKSSNEERRASLKGFFQENADPESNAFKGGELAADIAGTAGVGGVLAKGARAIPVISQYAPKLAAALESGGFKLGGTPATTTAGKVADAATRVAGGAAVGGASAGLVNPEDATIGGVLGGALPAAAKGAGMAGRSIAKALGGDVSPEVAALYQKAQNLGIDIPADRLINSKPLNSVAASLNYVPLSGRAATEDRMVSQLNRALSKTFGQDSDNVTAALRKAGTDLGDKFEVTLKGSAVKADNELISDLVANLEKANKELGQDGARIMGNMADEIMSKIGANGEIDGQAAYNIKKSLDRIGNRNTPEAFYARELKKSLMGALNRSLGPNEAAAFAKVREQYGNMLDLEGLAKNGAEGGISVARLANLKNINNQPLQDIADIAAQFVKPRESPHGAAQRVVLGGLGLGAAGATGMVGPLAAGLVAGRASNAALNSPTVRDLLIGRSQAGKKLEAVGSDRTLRALLYNSANRPNP